jgi:multidrug efflux pump subunit AcrB
VLKKAMMERHSLPWGLMAAPPSNTTMESAPSPCLISVGEINADLAAFIEQEGLKQRFDRLRILFAREIEQQTEAVGNAGIAFMVCMIVIFFLLSLLFNSLSQPFLVISVIPFGLMGVLVAFALQGIEMSMMAFIGILGLAGVLVNDSLVMIHNLNQIKREKGPSALLTVDEIAQGAKQRLRPIVITLVTTVAGLAPGAYGIAGDNPFMTPIFSRHTASVSDCNATTCSPSQRNSSSVIL